MTNKSKQKLDMKPIISYESDHEAKENTKGYNFEFHFDSDVEKSIMNPKSDQHHHKTSESPHHNKSEEPNEQFDEKDDNFDNQAFDKYSDEINADRKLSDPVDEDNESDPRVVSKEHKVSGAVESEDDLDNQPVNTENYPHKGDSSEGEQHIADQER